jgi:hypothetical protein
MSGYASVRPAEVVWAISRRIDRSDATKLDEFWLPRPTPSSSAAALVERPGLPGVQSAW